MADNLVIIPTYNEKENIHDIVSAVMGLDGSFHVLVVDDNSPDGTAVLVEELQPEWPGRIHLLKRPGKQGLGTAYIDGFKWAISHDYEFIFEMDADFSHNPLDLLRLRAACENSADLAVGSRYVKDGKLDNWPMDRKLLSYGASLYVRIITGMPVKDPTAGFICYKRKVLQSLPLEEVRFVGYAFQIEMKYRSYLKGFKLSEVPITFADRKKGTSKMNKTIISEAISGVLQLKLAAISGKI